MLSNLYLCPMTNNSIRKHQNKKFVVNCFQICIFVLWQTTLPINSDLPNVLWIAFKFVSLSYDKQHYYDSIVHSIRCELLSNLYLCPMTNNLLLPILHTIMLWISFKFVSLSYDKQQGGQRGRQGARCELLSNLYLCPMTNNK